MKKPLVAFLLVTAVNIGIYAFRDAFQFVKHSTYPELYSGCDAACRDKWDDYLRPYSETSLNEARNLLHSLGLDTGATLTRVAAIGRHLYQKFHRQAGYPEAIIHRSAPLDQYRILSADTAQKIWCGTYAQMFSFFCWSQGIVCRNLEIYKPGDHHILNECFLPESGRWVMTDVTNGLLWAKGAETLLNAQDFVRAVNDSGNLLVQQADTLGLQAFSRYEPAHGTKNYYRAEYPFYYYHAPHLALVYSALEKAGRYALPLYWYEIYSADGKTNFLFWVKGFFLALWLILAGAILFKFFK